MKTCSHGFRPRVYLDSSRLLRSERTEWGDVVCVASGCTGRRGSTQPLEGCFGWNLHTGAEAGQAEWVRGDLPGRGNCRTGAPGGRGPWGEAQFSVAEAPRARAAEGVRRWGTEGHTHSINV